jgi:hypothetical protein
MQAVQLTPNDGQPGDHQKKRSSQGGGSGKPVAMVQAAAAPGSQNLKNWNEMMEIEKIKELVINF